MVKSLRSIKSPILGVPYPLPLIVLCQRVIVTPMTNPGVDQRSAERRARDEEIAAEAPLPPLQVPSDAVTSPVETYLAQLRRPVAVAGIVENGLVRPVDPAVKLPEHSRVIIVTSERT